MLEECMCVRERGGEMWGFGAVSNVMLVPESQWTDPVCSSVHQHSASNTTWIPSPAALHYTITQKIITVCMEDSQHMHYFIFQYILTGLSSPNSWQRQSTHCLSCQSQSVLLSSQPAQTTMQSQTQTNSPWQTVQSGFCRHTRKPSTSSSW